MTNTNITDLRENAGVVGNPFQSGGAKQVTASQHVEQERAIQEVQAAMVIAKRFPRNTMAAMDRIIQACTRPTLAENAIYAYPRGGTMVTGPSIRLAEAIAQCWGNLQFGVRELSQQNGESTVEAFCWDIETNTRQIKEFQVKHQRKARGEIKNLNDPRDIYELVANQGARRLRACILGIIPGDVTDQAKRQIEITQKNNEGAPDEQIKKLVEAFRSSGVTPEQIAKRLGHRLESTISAEVLSLKRIYVSLRDGMSKATDWFDDSADVAPITHGQAPATPSQKTPTTAKPAPATGVKKSDLTWPKKFTDEKTGEVGWTDSTGAIFDRSKHGWSAQNNEPSVKFRSGVFRAVRKVKAPAQQESPVTPADVDPPVNDAAPIVVDDDPLGFGDME